MLLRGGLPAISIIVPVFRERALVSELLATLEPFVGLHELIIVDGGSNDGTFEALDGAGIARTLLCTRGRPQQMNAGARASTGRVLLFLHADTEIDPEAPELALKEIDRGADAGCFMVRSRSRHLRLRIGAKLQSLRSRALASATGDQAIFMRRSVFLDLGGFSEHMPICEDLDLVDRLGRRCGTERFVCVPRSVSTSGRRWEAEGINRTIALMWALRAAYHLGAHPATLARYYEPER
jgi:rSAM/selenodomain-associated transferase 2